MDSLDDWWRRVAIESEVVVRLAFLPSNLITEFALDSIETEAATSNDLNIIPNDMMFALWFDSFTPCTLTII